MAGRHRAAAQAPARPGVAEPEPGGGWRKRRGRLRDGFLDERRAYREMSQMIDQVEVEQKVTLRMREARFEDAAELWMEHLEFEKRVKPSTLDRHRTMLAKPEARPCKATGRRIMREFGGRKLTSITTDIRRFLARLDREDVSARTVNVHRQVLHSIFEHARRKDTFGLRFNPVADTAKRPEEGAALSKTFEPHEIRAIAEAAMSGLHRGPWRLQAFGLLRGDRRGVEADQRAGRGTLPPRRIHRPTARRAAGAAPERCRPRASHPLGVALDVGRRGVEHQVETVALCSDDRPGCLRASAPKATRIIHRLNRLRLLQAGWRSARSISGTDPLYPRPGRGRGAGAPLSRSPPQLWQR